MVNDDSFINVPSPMLIPASMYLLGVLFELNIVKGYHFGFISLSLYQNLKATDYADSKYTGFQVEADHLSLHPTLRVCSSDTILWTIRELSEENITYTSDKGKTYAFNAAERRVPHYDRNHTELLQKAYGQLECIRKKKKLGGVADFSIFKN